MLKIRKWDAQYKVGIAALSSAISVLALDFFRSHLQGTAFLPAYVLVGVSLAIFLLDSLFQSLISHSQTLRRVLMGHDFIEGYWHDESFDPETGEFFHGVLIRISYQDGDSFLTGVTFNSKGERVSTFRSEIAMYSRRVLFYGYEAHTEYTEDPIEKGIGQLQFDLPPLSYTGFYSSSDARIKSRIVGEKVSKKDYRRFNKFRNVDDRRCYVVQMLQTRREDMPEQKLGSRETLGGLK